MIFGSPGDLFLGGGPKFFEGGPKKEDPNFLGGTYFLASGGDPIKIPMLQSH